MIDSLFNELVGIAEWNKYSAPGLAIRRDSRQSHFNLGVTNCPLERYLAVKSADLDARGVRIAEEIPWARTARSKLDASSECGRSSDYARIGGKERNSNRLTQPRAHAETKRQPIVQWERLIHSAQENRPDHQAGWLRFAGACCREYLETQLVKNPVDGRIIVEHDRAQR